MNVVHSGATSTYCIFLHIAAKAGQKNQLLWTCDAIFLHWLKQFFQKSPQHCFAPTLLTVYWKYLGSSPLKVVRVRTPLKRKPVKANCNTMCGATRRVSRPESQEGKTPSPSISRQSSIETDRVSRDFVDFLKNLQKPGREVHKQSRAFIDSMGNKKVSHFKPNCCLLIFLFFLLMAM